MLLFLCVHNVPITFLSCYSISRLAIGNNSDPISVNQMKSISIFVHERGNFLYYKDQKKMPNSFQILNNFLQLSVNVQYKQQKNNSFRKDYENIFTLKKKYFKSLSRADRQCEDRDDYNWGDCLDESFYLRKGR